MLLNNRESVRATRRGVFVRLIGRTRCRAPELNLGLNLGLNLRLALGLFLGLTFSAMPPAAADTATATAMDSVLAQQLGCLALNIYHEGRGEPVKGRAAIAMVTMNRVRSKRYPDSVCAVVWQPRQFSWTRAAARDRAVKDPKAWQQAKLVAELFLNGAFMPEIGNAMHYHAVGVQPQWSDHEKRVAHLGGHFFYAL